MPFGHSRDGEQQGHQRHPLARRDPVVGRECREKRHGLMRVLVASVLVQDFVVEVGQELLVGLEGIVGEQELRMCGGQPDGEAIGHHAAEDLADPWSGAWLSIRRRWGGHGADPNCHGMCLWWWGSTGGSPPPHPPPGSDQALSVLG
ncbi:hypothetical protein [Streptomyces sp. NPDC059564]|uniref:hypothetical protein n=1 Tax=Streptomyces sp. NPDC059564 TaxID=3346865 RepID=UPI00369F5BBD